ncbi:MAG: Ig domain-containing protein, partial [Huintestinicola sp.]
MTKSSARTFKAFVCTMLALLFALTMVSFPASVSALGLNKSSITVTKGYSTTLSVSGANGAKVTWSSSDKTVATVSSSGKVVGKSVGTAVISAKVSGQTLKCNVKVVGGKLSFSSKEVSLDSGEYKYITVRAKGSHGIKAVPADKSVVKATWVKPWDGDDIRLRLTAVGSGSTYVRVQLTKYPDVYADIKVTVNGGDAMLEVNRENITALTGESASLIVYSDVDNMLSYSLSDNTVASVSEGAWNKGYCTYTIKGLKEGTTTLTLTRKDNSKVKKTITIKVSAGGYYVVSTTPLNQTVYSDTVYQWVDETTRT